MYKFKVYKIVDGVESYVSTITCKPCELNAKAKAYYDKYACPITFKIAVDK